MYDIKLGESKNGVKMPLSFYKLLFIKLQSVTFSPLVELYIMNILENWRHNDVA